MRIGAALRDFFQDLFRGELVALLVAGFFLLLLGLAATIWIIDIRRRRHEAALKEKRKNKLKERQK